MPSIALQQVSSRFARENAARTLQKPIALRFIHEHLAPSVAEQLASTCPEGLVYVWGAKIERTHQTVKMVDRESLVLFRRGTRIYKRGVVIETTASKALAESLWGRDTDGETWPNIFFFAKIAEMDFSAARVNSLLDRSEMDNWQGLVVLPIQDSERVQAFFSKELNAL